jgi:hypothetical protein
VLPKTDKTGGVMCNDFQYDPAPYPPSVKDPTLSLVTVAMDTSGRYRITMLSTRHVRYWLVDRDIELGLKDDVKEK